MNITPKVPAAPGKSYPSANQTEASPRERAIAKLLDVPQTAPVKDATRVAPEELGAITPPSSSESNESRQTGKEEELKTPAEASEPKKEEPESNEPPLSQQYAIFARKEKALRAKVQAQEAAAKQRESAFAEREAKLQAKESEYASGYISKAQLTEDPWTVLAELGITYDQITERAINQQQMDPHMKAYLNRLEAEVKATREVQQQAAKQAAEQQTQAYQNAVNQIRLETKNLVSSSEEFETIHQTGSVDDVVELIERTWKEEKRLLDVEDACRQVEEYLVEEAMKIAKLKKIQSRLSPPPAKKEEALKQDPAKQQQPLKTLTNSVSTQRQLTRRERAILAFNNGKS